MGRKFSEAPTHPGSLHGYQIATNPLGARGEPKWELLVHTRQFSYEWQIQGLQDTENKRVRKPLKTKDENRCESCAKSEKCVKRERPVTAGRPEMTNLGLVNHNTPLPHVFCKDVIR
jgi:hypothetical protein